jgi:hypothetical protein
MTWLITAALLLIGLCDLALTVICWKSRTVLGGVLGASGCAVVVVALVRGVGRETSEYSILISSVALLIGAGLYGVGQVFERLLADPDDHAHDRLY